MNIGQYLKSVGITKKELAEEIGLSRPTLNLYIGLFESGKKIENERYDIIFKRLFSDKIVSKEIFKHKMDSVKFLLERDRKFDIGFLEPEAADTVARIHNIMVNDMRNDDWDRNVYETIRIILSRYRSDVFFRELSGYFSDLNSDSDISMVSDQTKAYYAAFYKCFRELINNPILDVEEYNNFIKRKAQLSAERAKKNSQKSEKIKKIIDDKLKEVEKEFLDNGVELSEEELLTELLRRVHVK